MQSLESSTHNYHRHHRRTIHRQSHTTLPHRSTLHPPPTTTHTRHSTHSHDRTTSPPIMHFSSLQHLLQANPRSRHRQSTFTSTLQRSNHTHRTYLANHIPYLFTTTQPSPTQHPLHYVDNRYILLNEQYRSALPITTLAHPDFYEHPVEIEPVDDDHLLGFLIDPLNRTVTSQLPTHPWQIRDPQPAGSHRLRLSGLQSRHHTLRKYTFPQQLAPTTAQQLMQLYMTKGHSKEHCAAALRPRGKRTIRQQSHCTFLYIA